MTETPATTLDLLEDPDGAPYPDAVQWFLAQHMPLLSPYDEAFRADLTAALRSVTTRQVEHTHVTGPFQPPKPGCAACSPAEVLP